MHSLFESDLSFLLFLPTFAIIGALYCAFPRRPRSALRWLADIAVVLMAAVLSIIAMRWGFRASIGSGGALWKQIVATLLAYGVFLGVLVIALAVRAFVFRRGAR